MLALLVGEGDSEGDTEAMVVVVAVVVDVAVVGFILGDGAVKNSVGVRACGVVGG